MSVSRKYWLFFLGINSLVLLLACHSRTQFEQPPLEFNEEKKSNIQKEEGTPATQYYFAKQRPENEYTLRLSFQHVCTPTNPNCSESFSENQWRVIMNYADSMSVSYSYFPTETDPLSMSQIRSMEPKFPIYAKGYATPLIFESQMRSPYELREGIRFGRAYHTLRTPVSPDRWAMEIEERQEVPGTAVTMDPLVNFSDEDLREERPLRYPIRFYKFHEIFPNQKQYQLDTNCVKRDIRPFETVRSLRLNRLDPTLNLDAELYHPHYIQGLGDAGLNNRGYYQNRNERAPFPQIWGSFTEERSYLSIQDAACFQIDPSKEETPTVVAEAMQNQIQELGSDGIITDNFGGAAYKSLIPFGKIRWGAIPWRAQNNLYYWIQSSEALSSSHFRPRFDRNRNPSMAYANAFLNFTERTREIFEQNSEAKHWLINLNTLRSMFQTLPKLSEKIEWIRNHLGSIWDEKFGGKGSVDTPERKKEFYVSLVTAYEASRQGKPAILSGMFLNYNDIARENYNPNRDPWGFGKRFSIEKVIAHYLLVLVQPTIQIHWDRRSGYISYPNNNYEENYYSTDVLLEKLVHQNTWIRFLSQLKAGRPVMETAGITGSRNNPHQLMYRQFENVLVLSNMTPETLAVQLPPANSTYTYLRMNHWNGTNPDDEEILPSDYFLTPPSKLLSNRENGKYLAKLDRYQPGDVIYISPGANLVLYSDAALPLEELPQGIERFDKRFLITPQLKQEAINAANPLQLLTENYRFFLDVPPELDEDEG